MKILRMTWPILSSLAALAAAGGCSGRVSEGRSAAGGGVPEGPDAAASADSDQVQSTTEFVQVWKGNSPPFSTRALEFRQCLSMTMERDPATRQVPCSVISASASRVGCNPALGLLPAASKAEASALAALQEKGMCGVDGAPSCSSLSVCAVEEATGPDLQGCLAGDPFPLGSHALFCYGDPDNGGGSASIAASCTVTDTERHSIRVALSSDTDNLVVACFGNHATPASLKAMRGRIGDAFTPSDEAKPNFAGYGPDELSIETGTPSCESGVGLVYGFSGRTGCPYGQAADKTDPSRVDATEQACFTPTGTPVVVPVRAQMLTRRPSTAVYCSCRCDGSDPTARYCDCPSGFECKKLVSDYGFASDQVAGSYCIKAGTDYDPNANDRWCDGYAKNCGTP